jgi:hypothetical protein
MRQKRLGFLHFGQDAPCAIEKPDAFVCQRQTTGASNDPRPSQGIANLAFDGVA